MRHILSTVVLATVVLAHAGITRAAEASFEMATVHFEQNATDGDVEVVFEVKAGDEGLARLVVRAPDGRVAADFTAPDGSTLGIRQFRFESPEPRDVARLKAAYPEGVYTFAGTTVGGDRLHGESTLNHQLPATVRFLRPAADAEDVATSNLVLAWAPVRDLAAYIIEIEQDELGVNITARLPASATSFAVPHGFLRPGVAYQLGIGTVTRDGNISFVETSFATAAGRSSGAP